jgi:hypothetical protein
MVTDPPKQLAGVVAGEKHVPYVFVDGMVLGNEGLQTVRAYSTSASGMQLLRTFKAGEQVVLRGVVLSSVACTLQIKQKAVLLCVVIRLLRLLILVEKQWQQRT